MGWSYAQTFDWKCICSYDKLWKGNVSEGTGEFLLCKVVILGFIFQFGYYSASDFK